MNENEEAKQKKKKNKMAERRKSMFSNPEVNEDDKIYDVDVCESGDSSSEEGKSMYSEPSVASSKRSKRKAKQ